MGRSKSFRKSREGQASSGELIVAYLIFVFALALAISFWVDTTSKIKTSEKLTDFEDTAVDIAEKLIRTGGIPSNWTPSTVSVIGISDSSRILNTRKVGYLVSMMNSSTTSYEDNKYLLGTGKYDFYLVLEDINGNTITLDGVNCTTGKEPTNDAEALTVVRTAVLEGNITRLRLTLWHNETIASQ